MKKVKNYKAVWRMFEGCNRAELAKTLGVSVNYLSQIIDGFKQVSGTRAIEWHNKTNGIIDKKVLRPDYFGDNV